MSLASVRRLAAAQALVAALAAAPLLARTDAQPSPSPSPAKPPAGPAKQSRRPPSTSAQPASTPHPAATARPATSPQPGAGPHVYSNRDLPEQPSPEPDKGKGGKKADKTGEKAEPAPTPEPTPDAAAAALEAERQRLATEEASWRRRADLARITVTQNEAAVAQYQEEAGKIANRILMSTDTNEILRLRGEQQKVQASLDAARGELDASRRALENLQEEARRAGVPPGWVREP